MYTAKYSGGEITIWFAAQGETTDYGPGTPTVTDPNMDTVEITGVEIFGHEVDADKLPADLLDTMRTLDLEWERV